MSNEVLSDPRRGYWWGMFCPRTLHNKSWMSRGVSWVGGLTALLFGAAIAVLHVCTLPLIIALVLAYHGIQGDARVRTART